MFKSTLEEDRIKFNTRWDEARSNYKNNPYFKELHPYDRISVFVEYILEAERKHEEEEIQEKRLKERSNRVNFRNLLKDKLLSGEITYKSNWRTFVVDNKDEKSLLNMMDQQQQGTTAH